MSPSSLESPGRAPAFSGPLEKPAATLDLLMLIPTYNESENIIGLIERVLALSPHWGVLVVDDHSPDGTWALVEEFQKNGPPMSIFYTGIPTGGGESRVSTDSRRHWKWGFP